MTIDLKRKKKWEIIKDNCMTIDVLSLLLEGATLNETLSYTYNEYSIPLMDWAG